MILLAGGNFLKHEILMRLFTKINYLDIDLNKSTYVLNYCYIEFKI